MDLMSQRVSEAITSLIPCGATVLDLRPDRRVTPIEHALPYGCTYLVLPGTADSLTPQVLKDNRVDYLVLNMSEGLSTTLIHVSRLLVSLRLVLILYFNCGQMNAFVEDTIKSFGLTLRKSEEVGSQQVVRIERSNIAVVARKRVLVLSSAGWPNFGDRLGFHLIHKCLPPSVTVRHLYFPQIDLGDVNYDLLVLWLGTSVFGRTLTKEVLRLMEQVPHVVGIFGTQYRRSIDSGMMTDLLGRLSVWYARYEEDVYLYGKYTKCVHLGDWLIDAFPIAEAYKDGLLTLGPNLISQELPLDRLIQQIQACKRVSSSRLHPLLCALTSAEEVGYREQREFQNGETSGKFRSLFLDVFGRDYPEGRLFTVDRDAVVAYKTRTATKIRQLRDNLSSLLSYSGESLCQKNI